MAQRPALTDSSFLNFLFHPKKASQPTGLRKSKLASAKGRNPRRLRAYNNLTAVQQETLKRSGQREAYLKGETTLAKAKAALRPTAVNLGIAKPVKTRQTATPVTDRRARLDAMIQQHLRTVIVDAGQLWNQATSDAEMVYLDPDNGMLGWDYGQVKHAGRRGSEYEVVGPDHKTHNPFWYH